MHRSTFIQVCLYLTLGLCLTAVGIKVLHTDVKQTGGFGGELMVLLSPVFFGMAAKRAMHMGRMASVIAAVGVLLAAGGLAASVHGKSARPPAMAARP
ncbi:hypothetical protein L6V77_07055 [Myxococcota bacterium]|jgi:hypothetical protein|nr:hypothetical protein [Myxococcota bacterium]